MRISDWSSDVCSSDLAEHHQRDHEGDRPIGQVEAGQHRRGDLDHDPAGDRVDDHDAHYPSAVQLREEARERGRLGWLLHQGMLASSALKRGSSCNEIGRASCKGTSVSVRLDLGGRRIIQKKIKNYNQLYRTDETMK